MKQQEEIKTVDLLPLLQAFWRTSLQSKSLTLNMRDRPFLDMLNKHKIIPQVALVLKSSGEQSGISHPLIRDYYYLNSVRNVRMALSVVRITKVLTERGIMVIPFKGVVLSQVLYGDVAKRQCVDADFMVKRKDARKATQELQELGFEPLAHLSPSQYRAVWRFANTLTFQNKSTRELVDLHWGIDDFTFHTFKESEVFTTAQAMELEGEEIKTLHPRILLYFLCHHGFRHNWAELNLSMDIAAYIKKFSDSDWNSILDDFNQRGALPLLLSSLFLVNRLFRIALPQAVLKRGKSTDVRETVEKIYQTILYAKPQSANQQHHKILRNAGVRKRWRDKWAYFKYYTKPKTSDISTFDLPVGLHSLYYWVRLMNIGKRYI